jgi:hypothetical protein
MRVQRIEETVRNQLKPGLIKTQVLDLVTALSLTCFTLTRDITILRNRNL